MKQLSAGEAEKEFRRAQEELAVENTLNALGSLEKGLKLEDDPHWHSSLGYCIAKERGQYKKAVELCLFSCQQEPNESLHYFNLGRVYLLAGNKEAALQAFRDGVTKDGSAEIMQKLIELGMRKPPFFSSLERSHPINKYLGLLLRRLSLR